MELIVGISGASGVIYGIRALEVLAARDDVTTHLVMTPTGRRNVELETTRTPAMVEALADVVHAHRDVAASIASGSYPVHGMLVAPCSIRTLSAIANCHADNLLTRAADVTLKERRPLVLVPRETPLHVGHTRLLHDAATMGAILVPPVPAFYTRPTSIEDIVDHTVGKALAMLGVDTGLVPPWTGPPA